MSYTAWNVMRTRNVSLHGIDAPLQPPDPREAPGLNGLEAACLDFIRDWCEELRFEESRRAMDDTDGRGASAGQVPLNMERDTDRLCLESALYRFLQSGATQDAFDVYFCYLEMFVGSYVRSNKMIELLAEFESNASALLMKHRDHYSHSVYVFALGLAVYRNSPMFRTAYRQFYRLAGERPAAHHFLQNWGLAALFHDIGYPFELPFEQIKSYFGGADGTVPFVSYRGVSNYVAADDVQQARLAALLGQPLTGGTLHDALAARVAQLLEERYGFTAERLKSQVLDQTASRPDKFNYFMDHAYFSAVLLLRKLMEVKGPERLTLAELDAITAILLHNSIFKFEIRVGDYKKPLEMERHPIAWLLMLCDELQCWDRTSYGQNSRRELHPMWCELEFGADRIRALYQYDRRQEGKRDHAKGTYPKMQGERPAFVTDIEKITALNRPGSLTLEISTCFAENRRVSRTYLSDSSFLHLYNFAVALNGRYQYGAFRDEIPDEQLERDFDGLSLEYKLSNILQAKAFARYLDAIGCFYTDRPVAYEKLERFREEHMAVIGPMEHDRWVEEKRSMGWRYGADYLDRPDPRRVRELTRTHDLIIDSYSSLNEAEQAKDTEPMNCMLRLIEQFDGLRIYRMPGNG